MPVRSLGCFLLVAFVLVGPGRTQSIFTVAGGGTDDSRPATVAGLSYPSRVTVDRSGNLYIADDHRIRKVTAATGIITTVAGIGVTGFSGDGGPATAAVLSYPKGVSFDGSGNLYIADQDNHRIRKVSAATGIITTVAGSSTEGFSGDDGPATEAWLSIPSGVALDGLGNLYIADTGNHRIRKVLATTGIITTVAGIGTLGFSGDAGPASAAWLNFPNDVAVDSSGDLYIADQGNDRIRKVIVATGIITTVAGTSTRGFFGDEGPATAASLWNPLGVTLDGSGNLYIADTGNDRIRKVSAATGIITTVAGGGVRGFSGDQGPATAASLYNPGGVGLDGSRNLYIADTVNARIRKVSAATGIITTAAGTGGFSGDGNPATAASLSDPVDIALGDSGDLYIAETGHDRIRKVSAATGIVTTVVGIGRRGFSGDGGPATAASLAFPLAVALDASGNLYIADTFNSRIRKVSAATGIITTVVGTGSRGFSGDGGPATAASLHFPTDVALDDSANLYIADRDNARIRKVAVATGIITTLAGTGTRGSSGDGGLATAAALSDPNSIALNGSGDLYIADSGNDRIRKVSAATGIITTVAGTGTRGFSGDGGPATGASLHFPTGVALDGSGNFYIADSSNDRIRKVTAASGIITTVAGTGARGFLGDEGPATAASLIFPSDVALDRSTNVYIADGGSGRIRVVPACVSVTAPQLASPADGSLGLPAAPRLAWTAVRGAFRYDIYLDTANPPKKVVVSDIATTTFAPANLEPLTQYYWQVVAKGDPFCVPFSRSASPIRTFTTTVSCTAPGSFGPTSP